MCQSDGGLEHRGEWRLAAGGSREKSIKAGAHRVSGALWSVFKQEKSHDKSVLCQQQ